MQYDSNVIVEFAAKLYKRAGSIILSYTVFGVLLGAIGGLMVIPDAMAAVAGAVLLGIIGFKLGTDKAFQLKLQAQIALCQVQIETNTG